MSFLLLLTIFLPLAAALAVAAAAKAGRGPARMTALAATLATLGLTVRLLTLPGDLSSMSNLIDWRWVGSPGSMLDVRFSLGLDGLSVWLFALTSLLMVTAVLVSWEAVRDQAPAFYSLLLVLQTGMLGVFAARDIILFYIFFEFTLIPLFFLIGIWGSEERRYAAVKFFLFTFAGSVLTFLGLLAIVLWNYRHGGTMTFSIAALTEGLSVYPIWETSPALEMAIFLALFAGFAIKVPLFPLHTWLPLAHVQAPTAGSVILAGVLLKIGTYGFVRFSLAMLPHAAAAAMPWVLWLSVAGIVYGALVALAQTDIKRLIAYSSVSHLGFCMLGLFAFNPAGMQGGVLQMVNHGLSTGGLFAIVGMLYERYHTRAIKDVGGLARRTPLLAFFLLLFTFSSIGLPGLNGFTGEFLLLLGMFQRAWGSPAPPELAWQLQAISVVAVLGVVLGAWYMLWLVQRTFFGPLREPHHHPGDPPVPDMSPREVLALAPLALFMVWIGVAPKVFLDRIQPAVDPIAQSAAAELGARGEAVLRERGPVLRDQVLKQLHSSSFILPPSSFRLPPP